MDKVAHLPFEPGLQLAKAFFFDVVKEILAQHFPHLTFSAGLLGDGSEVIGFDTPVSTDHDWGPRLQLFLSEDDFARVATELILLLEQLLPATFHGYQVMFSDPDRPTTRDKVDGCLGSTQHGVEVYTARSFALRNLGVLTYENLSIQDWLSFPEQKLLSIVGGNIFLDDSGVLHALQAALRYYPRDVWLHLISAQWSKIAQEQVFVARAGDVGDEIGSILIAARLIEATMRLCFLLERKFAPYSKWLGSAFKNLACASRTTPSIRAVQVAQNWKDRERNLCKLLENVGLIHGELGIPGAIAPRISSYHERPYLVINAEDFIRSVRSQISDEEALADALHVKRDESLQ